MSSIFNVHYAAEPLNLILILFQTLQFLYAAVLQTKTNLGFLQNVKYFQRALRSGAAKPNLTFISNSSISLCSSAANQN